MNEKNTKPIIQNSVTENVENLAIKQTTETMWNCVVGWDPLQDLMKDISTAVAKELKNSSFMTVNLELTESQKNKLLDVFQTIAQQQKDVYIAKREEDKRQKALYEAVVSCLRNIIEQVLAGIGAEINRGAIINAIAVAADTKNADHNKIELNHSKDSGDITIPTRGVFISTNCIEIIKDSIDIKKVIPSDK